MNRKGRLCFSILRKLRALTSAQLRRKMLKFNINAILQIKKLQTVITREEKTKKAAEKKTKKLSAQLKKNLNNAEDAESKAAQI